MPRDDSTLSWISSIINANKDKTFIDRLINRQNYPVINNPDGTYSTHLMSYVSAGDKYHVFPTILWDGENLQKLDWETAYKYSKQTGNYLEFDTPEQAETFTKRYKEALGIK